MDYPKSTPGVGLVNDQFADENPATGQIGSLIPAAWGNAVTNELLAVIRAAGIVPSEADVSQLLRAIQTITATDSKRSVVCATTGPIALSGLQTIDGVNLTGGERVLVKDQADAAQNWIYVASAGAWQRANDANESIECVPGHLVPVQTGTVNFGRVWQFINTWQPVLGTTALSFAQVQGRTGVAAGTYKSLSVDIFGRVTAGTNPTTLGGYGIADAYTKAAVDAALATKFDKAGGRVDGYMNVSMPTQSETQTALSIENPAGDWSGISLAGQYGSVNMKYRISTNTLYFRNHVTDFAHIDVGNIVSNSQQVYTATTFIKPATDSFKLINGPTVLPAGGTWVYAYTIYNATGGATNGVTGFSAGGQTIGAGQAGVIGWAWKIQIQ